MLACPTSGGNWNNGSNAGVWAMNVNNSRTNSNNNYGFRSDFISPHTFNRDSGIKGDHFLPRMAKSAQSAFSSNHKGEGQSR